MTHIFPKNFVCQCHQCFRICIIFSYICRSNVNNFEIFIQHHISHSSSEGDVVYLNLNVCGFFFHSFIQISFEFQNKYVILFHWPYPGRYNRPLTLRTKQIPLIFHQRASNGMKWNKMCPFDIEKKKKKHLSLFIRTWIFNRQWTHPYFWLKIHWNIQTSRILNAHCSHFDTNVWIDGLNSLKMPPQVNFRKFDMFLFKLMLKLIWNYFRCNSYGINHQLLLSICFPIFRSKT